MKLCAKSLEMTAVALALFLAADSPCGGYPLLEDQPPSPAQLWQRCQETLPPLELEITRDEVVPSDTVPGLKLRRIEAKFYSQVIDGRKWGHPSVIFIPQQADKKLAEKRKGKVVIVGQRSWDGLATGPWRGAFLGNYGEPIAARMGYATMICPVPGEYDGSQGREISIGFLNDRRKKTQDPVDHPYFRLAIPYVRALDVMAEICGYDRATLQAVIGGHSKRATSAYNAAAIAPDNIAGVIYMGNESTWNSTRDTLPWQAISPAYTQKWVKARVLYLGATNEDGYQMYNINRIQDIMGGKWAIEYIPNYRHASMSEKHFMNWQMWIAHVFEDRPLTRISDLRYEEVTDDFRWGGREYGSGTVFQARIRSPNKIIQVKIWYVYNDDEPFWRDLVWYPEFMVPQEGDVYAGFVKGKLPDAWLVEVKDIASGFPAYISSLPQDITGKKTQQRTSRGSRSRHWAPKKK